MGKRIDQIFRPGGYLLRKIAINGILLATFASFGLPGLPAQASAPSAPAASCYGGADVYYDQYMYADSWTDWYYTWTSTRCADLNVRVEDFGCYIWVDAQYYSPSQGKWIDGAHDDDWIPPNDWAEPIWNLRDGTLTAVRFYSNCDGYATIKIAA